MDQINISFITRRLWSLLLLGLICVGCSTEETPTQDPSVPRGFVKAEFSLNVPHAPSNSKTRMSATAVQKDGNFRGMTGITMFPFAETTIEANSVKEGTIKLPNYTIASNGLYTNSSSKLYQDVLIPLNTKSFLFYGEAERTGDSFADGVITHTDFATMSSPSNLTFGLQKIRPEGTVGANGEKIAAYLTSIANAEGWEETSSLALREIRDNFINTAAGSSNNIKAAVRALVTDLKDDHISSVANAIRDAIRATATDEDAPYCTIGEDYETVTFAENVFGNYPEDIHLPDGAAYIIWDPETKKFEAQNSAGTNLTNAGNISSYTYPAALYYWTNSPIYTSAESKASQYENATDWAAVLAAYSSTGGVTNGTVLEDTRSIALVNPVQYAVGRLDVSVKAYSNYLEDNGTITEGGIAKQFNIGNNFKLTGILVGGQKAVDWAFATRDDAEECTIYDANMSNDNIILSTSQSAYNHTLVLESLDNADVKIVTEFYYTGSERFMGVNGYIYPNTKFYLVGTLRPELNNHQYYTGKSTEEFLIKKAFVQDYTTTANITINSLRNAYNVLPDLRNPQLEFGLSVNLAWQTGITQEITID